jgi:hypothetical protein
MSLYIDDEALDQLLVVQGNAQAVQVVLSEQALFRLNSALERTAYYRMNIRFQEHECREAVARIREEVESVLASYTGCVWAEGGIAIDEDFVVRCFIWLYVQRGTLVANPKLGLKTSFIENAATRLLTAHNLFAATTIGRQVQAAVVTEEMCKTLLRKLWEKRTGHRSKYNASKKRLREDTVALQAEVQQRVAPRGPRDVGVAVQLGDVAGMPSEDLLAELMENEEALDMRSHGAPTHKAPGEGS